MKKFEIVVEVTTVKHARVCVVAETEEAAIDHVRSNWSTRGFLDWDHDQPVVDIDTGDHEDVFVASEVAS